MAGRSKAINVGKKNQVAFVCVEVRVWCECKGEQLGGSRSYIFETFMLVKKHFMIVVPGVGIGS